MAFTQTDVGVEQHYIGGEVPPYASGLEDTDMHHAEVGTFLDEFGTPLDPPIGWSNSDARTGGSMTAWVQAEAYDGVLRARTYLEFNKAQSPRETFTSWATVSYIEEIGIEATPAFWMNTQHTLSLDFLLTGSFEQTGSIQALTQLLGAVTDKGEGGSMGGESGGECGEEPIWETIASPGFNFGPGNFAIPGSVDVTDYCGSIITAEIVLEMSLRNSGIDGINSGKGTLDFYGTASLQSISLLDENNELVVQFTPCGMVIAGNGSGLKIIPEPATVILLGFGGISIMRKRRAS